MADIGFSWVEWPYARIRRELAVDEGVVTRFVFQLEYDLEATTDGLPPHDWRTVARFDHDIDGQHNILEEGLHIDVYRNGAVYLKSYDFPTVPLSNAPRFCERYLRKNADFLIDRFERWHDIGEDWA
jgi:hypothetical protein